MHNRLFSLSPLSIVGIPLRKDDIELIVLVWKCETFSNNVKILLTVNS